MVGGEVLPGLPGAAGDPGAGPAEPGVLDGLLDDAARDRPRPADAVAGYRAVMSGDLRDLVGALVVPAPLAAGLPAALTGADLGTRILLATDEADPLAALDLLEAARSALWDEDRIEIVGRRLPLPAGTPDAVATVQALLPVLAATVPTWITLPPDVPEGVLDVLAADGAEHVTLDVTAGGPAALARLLRALVDRDLSFRAAGAPGLVADGPAPGALNVLCAVRAALNGAEPAELARVLAADRPGPLLSAVRRMSAADGAVTRAFLAAVEVPDAAAAAQEVARFGLFDEPVA